MQALLHSTVAAVQGSRLAVQLFFFKRQQYNCYYIFCGTHDRFVCFQTIDSSIIPLKIPRTVDGVKSVLPFASQYQWHLVGV